MTLRIDRVRAETVFRQISRSQSMERSVTLRDELERFALDLLGSLLPVPMGVRLVGSLVGAFTGADGALDAADRLGQPVRLSDG